MGLGCCAAVLGGLHLLSSPPVFRAVWLGSSVGEYYSFPCMHIVRSVSVTFKASKLGAPSTCHVY